MSSLRPVAIYGLEVPAGGFITDANPEQLPANFRITMAAIDPTAPPMEADEDTLAGPPRATLKIIRLPFDDEEDSEDDEDDDEDGNDVGAIERRLGIASEDDDESSDEESNGGPGEKTKKARTAALLEALKKEAADEDSMELTNGVGKGKGKGKASGDEEDDDEEDSDMSGEDTGVEEFVICTLDATSHYQQALDITINEGERVFFSTHGAFNIHLTGNYIVPDEEIAGSDDDDEDYSEDDELENALRGYNAEGMSDEEDWSEEDVLDDLKDPRIMEVDSEEEAPKLVKPKKEKKGKNKRAADDEDEDVLEKVLKPAETNGDKPLSKKQLKKLKNNAGQAAEAPKVEEKAAEKKDSKKDTKKEAKKESPTKEVNGSGKKVQFAKELEQGPTPTKVDTKKGGKTKVVQGVTIDERKSGSGPAAKKGDKISMRYIGKLKDGKQFDSNTKGEPFKFKLGAGEVIKGWDVGVQGMCAGSERRLVIPAHLAYGKQGQKGIPANSELTFDVKLLSIN
ncbi:hypothetical protein EJ08DRAFT_655806 [Tothia fuscella]|uniref:peptidylprolyl isomerase n=1 Tax=Tothia fuscella TaxID=1048955 RepID=A0A9P4P3K3_9PEZI|nr:hypothetical protein EJ08DRAFT_655806 [Tothia fuscella]